MLRGMLRTAGFALAAFLAAPAAAQLEPGQLLAVESAAGSVVDIQGGGDVSGAPSFATGLATPSALCIGPGGALYAAESGGELFDISAGGDFSAAVPFATGLGNALDLECSASQILVADNQNGRVVDATAGGDQSAAPGFAFGLPLLVKLLRDSEGTLWAVRASGEIFDVTAGGDFASATPFASGSGSTVGIAEHEGTLLVGSDPGGLAIEFGAGGNLDNRPVFASGVPVADLLEVPGLGLFAASGNGGPILEISAGGDLGSAAPFATGVATTFGIAGLAYVPGCGDGLEQPGETCDDGNTAAGDGCSALCQVEPLCGPSPGMCFVAAAGSLTIDERKPGKEKLKLALKKVEAPVGAAELGDPVAGGTRYGICLYDGQDALVGELQVARAGDSCGKKPCWKASSSGALSYKDAAASSDGVTKLSAKGGDAGKGKLSAEARNRAAKGQTALPTGLAAALMPSPLGSVQLVASDGACFSLDAADVKSAAPDLYSIKTP